MADAKQKNKLSLRLGSAGLIPSAIFVGVIGTYFLLSSAEAVQSIAGLTMADLLITSRGNTFMIFAVMMPLYVIFLQMSLRNDFDPNFVLKYKSRRELWNLHVLKIVLYAVMTAALIVCIVISVSMLYSCTGINWGLPSSYYFTKVVELNPDARLWHVILAVFLSYSFVFMGYGFVFLLTYWFTKNPLMPMLVVMFACGWDWLFILGGLPDLTLLLSRGTVPFLKWRDGVVWSHLGISAITCGVLYIAGSVFCKKKEFYR